MLSSPLRKRAKFHISGFFSHSFWECKLPGTSGFLHAWVKWLQQPQGWVLQISIAGVGCWRQKHPRTEEGAHGKSRSDQGGSELLYQQCPLQLLTESLHSSLLGTNHLNAPPLPFQETNWEFMKLWLLITFSSMLAFLRGMLWWTLLQKLSENCSHVFSVLSLQPLVESFVNDSAPWIQVSFCFSGHRVNYFEEHKREAPSKSIITYMCLLDNRLISSVVFLALKPDIKGESFLEGSRHILLHLGKVSLSRWSGCTWDFSWYSELPHLGKVALSRWSGWTWDFSWYSELQNLRLDFLKHSLDVHYYLCKPPCSHWN